MVNLKKSILLLFVILFSSCGDYYLATPDGGGLRSLRKYRWFINSRINPETIGIDTDVLYTRSHYYKNGTYYRFYKDINEALDSSFFNPKKGDIGFVIKRGKKYLKMFYIIMDAGQFMKSEIRMKGDTLVSYYKYGRNEYLSYYKKVKVPKKWLNYEPDF